MKRRASAALLLALLAFGLSAGAMLADDVYSPRTLEIARRLNCPVCAGESVADSQSAIARQMRGVIEQKVQAGESDEQIIQYFRDIYGDSILAEPPKSGFELTLWWVPVGVLALGAVVVALYLWERTRSAPTPVALTSDDAELDDELEAIARDVLRGDAPLQAPQ